MAKYKKKHQWWGDSGGEFDDDFDYGYGSDYGYSGGFWTSRYQSYKDNLFSWKKDDEGNIVHPSVGYTDNNLISDMHREKRDGVPGVFPEIPKEIPGFVGGDIYRLLYNEVPQIVKPEKGKEWWLDVISSLPVYGLAMQTNKSRFWSKIAAKAIATSIMQNMSDELREEYHKDRDNRGENFQRFLKNMDKEFKDGQSEKDTTKDSQRIQQAIQKGISEGISQAQKDIQGMRGFMQELGLDPNDADAKDGDPTKNAGLGEDMEKLLTTRRDMIEGLAFNGSKAIEFLKSTNSYFRSSVGKPYQVQESLLRADSFNDIINPELFEFPWEIENINVITTKRSMRVDIYIDRSGSMGSRLPVKSGEARTNLTIMDAVSIFAYKLYREGIVDNVFIFDSEVTPITSSQILFINRGGGTVFTNVVEHFKQSKTQGSKKMGFVLTDGCDDTHLHHPDLFWMFVEGGPGNEMMKTHSASQMRIWSQGAIMKISEYNHQYS